MVLDEVHYLGDPSRGSVWEEVIINCSKHIQLCAMSATVANADALGGWIDEVSNGMALSLQELGFPLTNECCMMVKGLVPSGAASRYTLCPHAWDHCCPCKTWGPDRPSD